MALHGKCFFLGFSLFLLLHIKSFEKSMESPLALLLAAAPSLHPSALVWPLTAIFLDYVGAPSRWPRANSLRAPEPESGSGRSITSTYFPMSPWL